KTMAARTSAESRAQQRQYFEWANASLKSVIDIAPHNAEVEFESADVLAEIARLDLKEGNPSSALTHGSAAKAALTRAIGLRPSDRRIAQSDARIDDLLMEIATNSKTNGRAQTA